MSYLSSSTKPERFLTMEGSINDFMELLSDFRDLVLPVGLFIIFIEPVEGERLVDTSKLVVLVFGVGGPLILFPITGVIICDPCGIKSSFVIAMTSQIDHLYS